jgi:HPt (histidine-containing phosphotransfer) domain-containing protein
MSDEFLQVATKEINDEIDSINKILKSCRTDSDIFKNSQNIDDHIHKIKGLAPMMGKPGIGIIAALNDSVRVSAIERLNVPEMAADRHLVILEKVS